MAAEENIFTVASDACALAQRTRQEVVFSFRGTETRAKPASCMADVVEIWFWKGQLEKWLAAASIPARNGG